MNKQISEKEIVIDCDLNNNNNNKHKNLLFENNKKVKSNKVSFYDKQL